MIVEFKQFIGMNPDTTEHLLPQPYAVEATNVYTDQGELRAWKAPKQRTGTWNTKPGVINRLYYLNNELFLAWAEQNVDVVPMPKAENTDVEVIFTGTDKPRYTNRLLAKTGGTNLPEVSYPLAVPTPSEAPTATVSSKALKSNQFLITWSIGGTTSNTGDRIGRSFVITYRSDTGRESAPSAASTIVYTAEDEQVTLTGPALVAPNASVTKIAVYGSASGGTFNFLKEVTLPVSSIVIDSFTAGSALETTLYSPPPDDLQGVVAMANGMLAGFKGNDLYFSEPYQGHAWPEDYKRAQLYKITGLAAKDNMLIVLTEGNPVVYHGNYPSQMSEIQLGSIQTCVSRRSIVDMGAIGSMYASKDGIVLVTNGQATMISDGIISENLFHRLNPASIHAYFYRDKYVAFYSAEDAYVKFGYWVPGYCVNDPTEALPSNLIEYNGMFIPAKGAFILDYKRKSVSFVDLHCTAAYSNKSDGKLYMVQHNDTNNTNTLWEFNESTGDMDIAWRCKPSLTPPTVFTSAKVRARTYPVTFELYVDDVLRHTQTVTEHRAFRLPAIRGTKWQPRILDSGCQSVVLAQSMNELSNVG